jgi:thioredoxin 1
MIAPVVEEIAKEYDGKLKVGKIDVDSNQQTPIQFGVRSIPTLLIFKNGKVVDQIVGAVPKRMLTERVTKHLN